MILKLTLSVLCLGGLAIGFAAHAAEDSKNPNAIDAVHQLPVLRKIVFEREPIFGAEERDRVPWLPLGLVNRLHAGTRVRVIRSELLFKEGERVSRDAIAESERKLRQTGFFGETQILPVYVSSDSVDVLVRTREIWTTEVNFQYERFEEQKIWALSFRERNFLGLAQSVQFSRRQDDDRSTGSVSIGNRQLFDGTWRGGFSLSDSDDGAASAWFLQKPFFQTDADWSLGGGTSHRSARVRMYVEGEGYVRPSGDFTEGEFFVMRKASSSESAVFRLGVGLKASKQRFAPESGLELRDATGSLGRTTRFDPTETENRRVRTLFLSAERSARHYTQERFLFAMGQVEDLPLGWQSLLQLGWATRAMGSSISGMSLGSVQSWISSDRIGVHTGSASITGLWAEDGAIDLRASGRWSSYLRLRSATRFAVGMAAGTGSNIDRSRVYSLGTDSGLRAARFREFVGDRFVRANAELRWVHEPGILGLMTPGLVAFTDFGTAWFESRKDLEIGDVRGAYGVGARIGIQRASQRIPIRIDLAWPMLYDNDRPGAVLSIGTGHVF